MYCVIDKNDKLKWHKLWCQQSKQEAEEKWVEQYDQIETL